MKGAVLYKWPGEPLWNFIQGNWTSFSELKEQQGFVLRPFDSEEKFLLQQEEVEHASNFKTQWLDYLIQLSSSKQNLFKESGSYSTFLAKSIEAVNNHDLLKVVASRNQFFELSREKFVANFEKLAVKFPAAFVYGLFHPEFGCWFGATPEVLVQEKENGFTTMALAGTIRSDETIHISDFSTKEIEEQKWVVRYIESVLKEKELNYAQTETQVVKTGALNHLKTDFTVQKRTTVSLLDLAGFLHPTPAVCGLPLQKAKQFILENEGYNRSLYTGYLGPVGLKHNGFFVNLRCGQWVGNGMVLYAGGGINKGSLAEKEMEEVRAKMENLLSNFKE